VLQGELVDIAVLSRTPSDRAAAVRITGTLGVTDIPATQARTLLGLRSTWFTIARTIDQPPSNAGTSAIESTTAVGSTPLR
jgi:peptidoglycan hydrolase-like amidase